MAVMAKDLVQYLDQLLASNDIKDYCANGWQLEGKAAIHKLVTGVTASRALVEAAIAADADAILVHHGWFWQGEAPQVVGLKYRRMAPLIKADINLFAYHLPLDLHPIYGNNQQLGELLGLQSIRPLMTQERFSLVLRGELPEPMSLAQLQTRLQQLMQHPPLLIGEPTRKVSKLAWCTGAAMREFAPVLDTDVELFISGEINEPSTHLALESGVAYMAAGHHATERLGVQALGQHLAEHFSLIHQFIDCPVPV